MKRTILSIVALLCMTFAMAQQKSHTIQRGETIESIAKKYNVSVLSLQQANPDLQEIFYVGMKIVIPESSSFKSIQDIRSEDESPVRESPFNQYDDNESSLFKPNNEKKWLFYEAEIGLGISSFYWKGGRPKKNISCNVTLWGGITRKNSIRTPYGLFGAIGLGYSLKGNGSYPLHYTNAKIVGGYTYKINSIGIFGKIGGYIGYPINKIENYKCGLDYGPIGSAGIFWERLRIAFSYEHGLAKISSSAPINLKNWDAFVSVSYTF